MRDRLLDRPTRFERRSCLAARAKAAGDVLRSDGSALDVRPSADEVDWLVLAEAERAPHELDDLEARTSALAEELHGEYHGFQAVAIAGWSPAGVRTCLRGTVQRLGAQLISDIALRRRASTVVRR